MKTKKKSKLIRNRIAYTVITSILLTVVFLSVITYVYKDAEDECFEGLHIQTQHIKENIDLQIRSDRENLITMANFAAKLYEDGEDFHLLFDSFKAIGLIENVGILMPDNSFITKRGTLNLNGAISFDEEVKHGTYISNRVPDLTNPDRQVIRSAVPVVSNENTVAILYGLIDLDTLKEKYKPFADSIGAQLYIVDRKNGDFIMNTRLDKLGNLNELGDRQQKEGYSYKQMQEDILQGEEGFAAFKSERSDEYLYMHYAPMAVNDWQIMLSESEHAVFAKANSIRNTMFLGFALIIIIMLAYLLLIFNTENKQTKINTCASNIRKLLLEVNQRFGSIRDALQAITASAKSRSAIFVDTDGEDFNYIIPSQERELLTKDARKYFIRHLLDIVEKRRDGEVIGSVIIELCANSKLKRENPEFYNFMIKHHIERVIFAGIADNKNHLSILGVVNPKKRILAKELLKDIGICFDMAIHNKKYLSETEHMAITDSMTELLNHMAYMHDIKGLNKRNTDLTCVYIDVNELHYINNKYGHAAGDKMLVFIADVLSKEFSDSHVYRIGGDEFVIFNETLPKESIEDKMKWAVKQIEDNGYYISVGISSGDKNTRAEELVMIAEQMMYDEKAKYYQDRENIKLSNISENKIQTITTGIKEVDDCIAIMGTRYLGVYSVSLETDNVVRILAPSYFASQLNDEGKFSDNLTKYIHDIVSVDYRRILLPFLKYDVLEKQLKDRNNVRVTYTKTDGEKVCLSIYAVPGQKERITDTIWIFEKENFS